MRTRIAGHMFLYKCHRRKFPGGSRGMPSHKFLKIRISKMAILCIVRRIPCLSATVKWGIERVIFRLKHAVYILSTIRVVFQHVLRDIYLLFRNHGMKIKILLGSGWFYQKCRASTPMRVFTQSRRFSGFKCSNAGQTRRARVTWGLWINIYKYSVKTIFWNKHTRYNLNTLLCVRYTLLLMDSWLLWRLAVISWPVPFYGPMLVHVLM